MNQDILDYIKSQRICVLAVEMPDGSPHAATLHFAESVDCDSFYFLTSPSYRKAEALVHGKISRASIVIGVNESDMRTMQLDGIVQLVESNERKAVEVLYYSKFPEKLDKFPEDLMFKFTSVWWRYTDWTTSEGKKIISSED